jgi:hypothetical protein
MKSDYISPLQWIETLMVIGISIWFIVELIKILIKR